ncbi:hypothetical protein SORBI_3006G248450 [Sorghum bicolor]|uniref:Uncharacterized protein n=1 Tax=Sorghum bicolor TaxID=4558 RepID=A0A1Z5RFL0_SORBI|nr:hypothetical protein SORBI_3006G248450 [Sorghum bicolor]
MEEEVGTFPEREPVPQFPARRRPWRGSHLRWRRTNRRKIKEPPRERRGRPESSIEAAGLLVPAGSPARETTRPAEPNRIRETAGIELTSGRGVIGVGGRERDGDQPKTNCPRCSPAGGRAGGRAALSAALLGRVARRLPAAAASVFFFSAVESDLIAQECPEEERGGASTQASWRICSASTGYEKLWVENIIR